MKKWTVEALHIGANSTIEISETGENRPVRSVQLANEFQARLLVAFFTKNDGNLRGAEFVTLSQLHAPAIIELLNAIANPDNSA